MAQSVKAEPGGAMDETLDVVGGSVERASPAFIAQMEEIIKANPEGITDEELRTKTPSATPTQRQDAINALLGQGKLGLVQMGTMLVYKPKDPAAAAAMAGSSAEESSVFQLVQDAGQTGIWIKDIRTRSGLGHSQLNKVLKGLESRKLIKCVRAVGSVRKKMYVLFSLTPDEALTGGAFYSEQEFDAQFADLLASQAAKFLEQRAALAAERFPGQPLGRQRAAFTPSASVRQHIADLDISRIQLSSSDVERVLDALVYEGRAEKTPATDGGFRYRALPAQTETPGIIHSPCTFCPVRGDCRPGGLVSPANCQYFADWLS